MNVDNTQEYTCLSLCSGYGGIELGLRRVIPNLRTVAYVEVEAFACANLVSKMEKGLLDAAPIWTDIKTFDGEPFHNRVYIVTGGYPCQPFSVAGRQRGEKDERHLWPFIRDIIEQVRPVWCFFENVAGHLRLGFDRVVRDLDGLHYEVQADIFTAEEVGAPHKRERLFILAHTRLRDRSPEQGQQQEERAEKLSGSGQLADTTARRIQGNEPGGIALAEGQTDEPRWPSRPGQPQYEWEEPRVVAESNRRRSNKKYGLCKPKPSKKASARQAQPRLGLSTNGNTWGLGKSRSRVDELRLLGNGVVPQQAEKAFRCLMEKFNAP